MSDNKVNPKSDPSKNVADSFVIRGTIRTVDLMNQSFALEPIPPYAFEKADDNGSPEKYLLLVKSDKAPIEARFVTRDCSFKLEGESSRNLGVIVSLKTGREKVEVGVSASSFDVDGKELVVSTIKIV